MTRRIGKTPSGRRAIQGARSGQKPFQGRSIRTRTATVDTKKGRQTVIVPSIVQKKSGGFVEFGKGGGASAVRNAMKTGDYAKVGRAVKNPDSPRGQSKLARQEKKATRRSQKFSARLGRISRGK